MEDWQKRNRMLLGDDAVARVNAARVAVFGLGGVGGFAAEGLARAGVGALTLIDHDTLGHTNRNRQIPALVSTIGLPKAEAMAARVRDINPDCTVRAVVRRYCADDREYFFAEKYDYIVDAIDLVSCKLDLIEQALARKIPIISALGTGNKLSPAALRVSDISRTHGCALARVMRKELRKRGILHTLVVWSPELPIEPQRLEEPPPGRRSVPASACWVPGCAGLMMAGEAVLAIAGRQPHPSAAP